MKEQKPQEKKTKAQILKEKYGFNRNKKDHEKFDEKDQKEDIEQKLRSRDDYAYNSDTAKKKFYG